MLTRGAASLLVAVLAGCEPASLHIEDAWLRAASPGRAVSAGYFVLENDTDRTLVLSSATSPDATRVELHTQEMDGDMMRMRPLEALEIPPRSRVRFAPGGHHLMLFDVNSGIEAATVVLRFADGTALSASFDVRALGPPTKDGK